MTPLKDALLKAAEWDERDAHSQALLMGYDSNYPTEHKAFEYGSRNQHARLLPLLQACAEVVEAAEDLRRLTQDICVDYTVEEGVFDNALASLREHLEVKDE